MTNRKASTTVAVKLAAAASSVNGSRFDLSVENESTSLYISPIQTLTRATEGTITLSSIPSSNVLDVVLHYDASGYSSAVGYLDYIQLTYERTLFWRPWSVWLYNNEFKSLSCNWRGCNLGIASEWYDSGYRAQR